MLTYEVTWILHVVTWNNWPWIGSPVVVRDVLHALIWINILFMDSIGKTVLSVSCARFKSHIYLQIKTPPPSTLRSRNPASAPAWAADGVVHKYPDFAHFVLVGRRSERLCRRLVTYVFIMSPCIGRWRYREYHQIRWICIALSGHLCP